MLEPGTVKITSEVMAHAHGMWAGMQPCWWVATHEPTGLSVKWSDHCNISQYKAREAAVTCLELMIALIGAQPIPATPGEGSE